MQNASIIAIGDELLIGQVLNTNAQWLAQELNKQGISVNQMLTVSDLKQEIIWALDVCLEKSDLVIITGGLGPTKDDITKHVLTQYFKTELVLDENRLAKLKAYFESKGKEFTIINHSQAMMPKDCITLENEVGTANGMWFKKGERQVVSLPGVPSEMKWLIINQVLPRFIEKGFGKHIIHKTLRTIGTGESVLAEIIENWENKLPEFLKLAYLPSLGQVRLRLSGSHPREEFLRTQIDFQFAELKNLVFKFIYADEDIEIEHKLIDSLKRKSLTLGIAESCTGGYLSHKITSVSGSSAVYKGSVISYSNDVKIQELEVTEKDLETYGAVSEQVVTQMANSILIKFGVDYALATSGIAGPSGGTDDKPVGTIWIALASKNRVVTKKLNLGKDRIQNIQLTSLYALELLWEDMKNMID